MLKTATRIGFAPPKTKTALALEGAAAASGSGAASAQQQPSSKRNEKRHENQKRNKASFTAIVKWFEDFSNKSWQAGTWHPIEEVRAMFEATKFYDLPGYDGTV